MPRHPFLIAIVLGLAVSLGPTHSTSTVMSTPDLAALQKMTARFAPADIGADLSTLPASERQALGSLVDAARLVDALFLRQLWAGNPAALMNLAADGSPLGQARLEYFLINKSPWSALDGDAPFVPGIPPKPEAANYYPADATKAEVEQWIATLDDRSRAEATGFFAVIRRGPEGRLRSVPYSQEYQPDLQMMASALRKAAGLTAQPTLKRFLETRAAAFLSNDYYESDVAWMELDASIEPTIGPYETYEDGWFGYKAAFEAFITIRDDAETRRLSRFSSELQELEDNLPIDPRYRNPRLGGLAPIAVVNVVIASGDGNRGVQTAAFNLPNDERVVAQKGSKRVMLKNMQEAKFSKVLVPIARATLAASDQDRVSFDAFFTHILMHELMHGLGPQTISVGGRPSTVRHELKETYSAIEEAKADVAGLWALQRLVDRGRLDASLEQTMYVTFLASALRSIRFGITEAHGRGVAIQINKFLDAGAVAFNPDGTCAVRHEAMKQAVTDLTREIMTLEAHGDHAAATELLQRFGVVRPEVQRALDRLADVPVDIAPRFVAAR
jgi:hypothetical protein